MKAKLFRVGFLSIAIAYFLPLSPAHACGDFLLEGPNGQWVNGRSMEFALDLKSALVVHPRGEKRVSPTPDGGEGLKWTSQYGFAGFNALGLDVVVDGLNEKGLSAGALWLPGSQYPQVSPEEKDRALLLDNLIAWILGNFSTVDQVKEGLGKVKIWAREVPELGMVPPLHFTVHDAQGKSLVVEFTQGKMTLHDNPVKVLTNAPTFDQQLKNLEKFKGLTNLNKPQKVDGLTLNGSGMLGMPGDSTPPSRFVRLATQLKYLLPPADSAQAVNLAFHLLDTVDIPKGVIKNMDTGTPAYDYTQWVVVKDLANQRIYFKDYQNPEITYVDLKRIPWEQKKNSNKVSFARPISFLDLTGEILKP